MRLPALTQLPAIGRYLPPLAALVAGAALLLFLLDRPEQLLLSVPSSECRRVAPADETAPGNGDSVETWSWALPQAAYPLVRAKTPRRESSFLFLGDRLIPLKFPYDEVPASEREITGWHLVEQDQLVFQLPAGVTLGSMEDSAPHAAQTLANVERQPASLRLEINGPMSGRRQFALAVIAFSGFAISCFGCPDAFRTVTNPSTWLRRAGVGLIALAVLASLIVCAVQRLPIIWRTTTLGLAWDRFDAIAPGLLLLMACCGWIRARRRRTDPTAAEAQNNRALPPADASAPSQSADGFVRWGWLAGAALFLVSFVRLLCWGVGSTHPWSPVGISSPFCSAVEYSDAAGYLAGAYHLISAGTLDEWNQRRPINAALFATRLISSGWNTDLAKWFQAVAVALAAAWAAREVAWLYGRYAGLAALALLWGCGRLFLATTLSEPLGFTLGSLGLVGLLRQIRTGSVISGIVGIGLMTLAQAARPGAMFVLPALVVCAAVGGRSWRERATLFALTAGMVAATMALNPLLSRLYGTQANLTGSNFSYTFAGLASGQSWSEVIDQYQEQLDELPNEKAVATFLYQEGFRLIRSQPEVFVGELLRGLVRFSIDFPRFLVGITSRSNIDALSPLLIPQVLFLAAIAGLAFWRQWHCLSRRDWALAWAIFMGSVTSIPLVFLDGGMRVFMATWPAVLAWIATGFASPQTHCESPLHYRFDRGSGPLAGLLAAVMGIAVVGPAAAHSLGGRAASVADPAATEVILADELSAAQAIEQQWAQASGFTGEVDWLQVNRRMGGPGVNVGSGDEAELTALEWQRELQISGVGSEAYLLTRMPQPPFRFDQVYDARSGTCKILFLPGDPQELPSGAIVVETDGGLRIFGRRFP